MDLHSLDEFEGMFGKLNQQDREEILFGDGGGSKLSAQKADSDALAKFEKSMNQEMIEIRRRLAKGLPINWSVQNSLGGIAE